MGSVTIENYSEGFLVDANLRHAYRSLKAIKQYYNLRRVTPSAIPVTKEDEIRANLSGVSITVRDAIIFDAIRANLVDIQNAASKTLKLEGLPESVITDYYLKELAGLENLVTVLYSTPLTRKVVDNFMSSLFDKVFKVYDEVFAEE